MLFGGTKALLQRPVKSVSVKSGGRAPYDLADIARALLGVVSKW
jgi:hypothetical protein